MDRPSSVGPVIGSGPFDPSLNVPTPPYAWLVCSGTLVQGETRVHDISNGRVFFVTRTPSAVNQEMFIQLGEDGADLPILSGFVYKCSGVRRLKVSLVITAAAPRDYRIVVSSDPNFDFTGIGRTTLG
jgi:hypothetical protein